MTTLQQEAENRTVFVNSKPSRGIPFAWLFHVELRKQLDTRAGRALMIIIGGMTALMMTVALIFDDPATLSLMSLVDMAVVPQLAILPVIGILAVTSEWSQRTGMTTFTLESRRTRVVSAKLLSALTLGAASFVAAVVLAALTNGLGVAFRAAPGAWAIDWSLLGGMGLMELIVIAQGLAFGLLLMNTPAALVVYYVLPTVWTGLGAAISWLATPAQWLDLGLASSLLYDPAEMGGTEWAKLLVAAVVWIGLPLGLGILRTLRREVK